MTAVADDTPVRVAARRVTDVLQPRNVLVAGMSGIGLLAAGGHWSGLLWGLLGALCAGPGAAGYISGSGAAARWGDRRTSWTATNAGADLLRDPRLDRHGLGRDAPRRAPRGILVAMLALWVMTVGLLAVNTVWKISVDSAVASSVVTLLACVHSPWWLGAYAVTAAVCWSRVALTYHPPPRPWRARASARRRPWPTRWGDPAARPGLPGSRPGTPWKARGAAARPARGRGGAEADGHGGRPRPHGEDPPIRGTPRPVSPAGAFRCVPPPAGAGRQWVQAPAPALRRRTTNTAPGTEGHRGTAREGELRHGVVRAGLRELARHRGGGGRGAHRRGGRPAQRQRHRLARLRGLVADLGARPRRSRSPSSLPLGVTPQVPSSL